MTTSLSAEHDARGSAAELHVLSSIALKTVFEALGPELERACRLRPVITMLASPAVQREINAGTHFDVAISNPPIVDDMIRQGAIIADTRVNIVRSSVGVVARAGAPKRDVSTMDGFKQTLRAARSVAHSDGGVGRLFMRMLDEMGMRAELQDKLVEVPAFSGAEVVSRGGAEIAILVTAAIPGVEGVELLGLPPAELRPHIEFAGGVGARSNKPRSAAAFLSYLTGFESDAVVKSVGMCRIPT